MSIFKFKRRDKSHDKSEDDCESSSTNCKTDKDVSKVVLELDKLLSHAYEHDLEEMTLPVELVMTCRGILTRYE